MRLGINCKLYRNTGTYGSPTWTAIDDINDCTVNSAWDFADASTRASRLKSMMKTQMDLNITGKVRVSLTGTAYLALAAAHIADSVIDFLVLDGTNATDGVTGYRFDGQVAFDSEDQSLGAVEFQDFKIVPSPSANLFKTVTVASGTPVFTTI